MYPGQVAVPGMSTLHLSLNSVAQVLPQPRAIQIPAEHNPAQGAWGNEVLLAGLLELTGLKPVSAFAAWCMEVPLKGTVQKSCFDISRL